MRTIRIAASLAVLLFVSCASAPSAYAGKERAVRPAEHAVQWNNDWARGAVFYEVFVRSFYDSNGDGKGDLQGLIAKLDYLQSLHVDALWLMPVFQSPSYHGYDTTDYETIASDYGTKADFQQLLAEAHRRNIRVIVDYVMNHTSNEHPWFVMSASGPSSPKRDWYIWSDTDPGWRQPWQNGDVAWHLLPPNGPFYYGVFWSGMPDLNYRNPEVKAEMFRIAREWLTDGVDGFRLDATRYLIEDGPGPGQADTPETHQLLKDFSANVASTKRDAVLVAENTVDTPTLATYYADVPMNFNFPLAGAIVDGVKSWNAIGILQTLRAVIAAYPAGAIDAPFLT
ncbi:MAG TPA: alpha-amylase family glycosyl hydrolase, partial [Thermoanaerobaculia bacterium]|nr:alpha-amylase family glycosyl hydrolase [Thermoanaerobaculia bacterium]